MTMMICSIPDATASSTAYWMIGRSTSGMISLGTAFVAGRKRVPKPAAGRTAFLTRTVIFDTPAAGCDARRVAARRSAAWPRARFSPGPEVYRTGRQPPESGSGRYNLAADDQVSRPHLPRPQPRSADDPYQPPDAARPDPRGRAGGDRDRARHRPQSGLPGRDSARRAEAGDRP